MTSPTGFDLVVVGAGAAGCVVAARLSEDPSRTVALVEAGPDLRGDAPRDLHDGWSLPTTEDWGYEAEPDARQTPLRLRRGKLLGGTSWFTRFAVRGGPADFDAWAARGNPGWSFDEVLPWFNRLESDLEFGDEPWHGSGGPIPVTRYPELAPTAIHQALVEAIAAAAHPQVADHNRPGAVGVGRMPTNTRDGLRVVSADAYLPAPGTRPNLTLRDDAAVARIVFEGSRAAGVELADGTRLAADRVVLSAGTYGSPAILMRSGIGPADHLSDIGIPVLVDLPGVGANLADHPEVDLDPGWRGTGRDGPVLHSIATFHSREAAGGTPDLLFWIADPPADAETVSIDVVLMKPRSRGSVRLRSADPADRPVIRLPSLDDPSDVERLATAYRHGLEIANRPEIRRLCSEAPPDPGTNAELEAHLRANLFSIPHVVGTCAMGPDEAAGDVVDASGAVHGADGLFVVDASIIPDAPSGFPHVITIMLAERLADALRRSE
jgi:choline dehydrogenase